MRQDSGCLAARVVSYPTSVIDEGNGSGAGRTLSGQRILVTGGSGTIGSRLVARLMELDPEVVRVLGRDETKQFYQRQAYRGRTNIRFLIGDIRDRDRLTRALEGIDVVFHCAALKHVEAGEFNPFEATQTNVLGTQNMIDAALVSGVRTFILTSSDKAVNPTSVMGATKLLAEKLVSAAPNYRGQHPTTFASVRFGNVLGSRGSALELFEAQIAAGGPVTVTDPSMTRFVMTIDRAVELALAAGRLALGGEVFVFKMPVARLADLVTAAIDVFAPRSGRDPGSIQIETIAPRPGEKAYEELMTEEESRRARDIGSMYAVLPAIEPAPNVVDDYARQEPAPVGAYRSDGVAALSLDAVRQMVEAGAGLESARP